MHGLLFAIFVRQRHKLLCSILGACDDAHPLLKVFRCSVKSTTWTPAIFCNQYNPHPIRDYRVKTTKWIEKMITISTTTIATYGSIYGCFQDCSGLSSRSDPCTYVYSATPFKHSQIDKPLMMHGPRLCFRLVFQWTHSTTDYCSVVFTIEGLPICFTKCMGRVIHVRFLLVPRCTHGIWP
jgi:hypothetical protein